jgi:hypothetical protein
MHKSESHFLLFVVAENVFFRKNNEMLLEQILLILNEHKAIILLVFKRLASLLLIFILLNLVFKCIECSLRCMEGPLRLDLSIICDLTKVSRTKYFFLFIVCLRIDAIFMYFLDFIFEIYAYWRVTASILLFFLFLVFVIRSVTLHFLEK